MAGTPRSKTTPAETTTPNGRLATVDIDDVAVTAAHLPKYAPSLPFLLAAHPDRFHVVDGVFLPDFRSIRLMPGVNGYERSHSVPVARAQDQRWTVLPTKLGPGGKSYLQPWDVVGGTAYTTVFETLYEGRDRSSTDRKALAAWYFSLVEQGLAPGPSLQGLYDLRDKLVAAADKADSRAKMSVEAERKAKALHANLTLVRTEIDKLEGNAQPAVKKASVDLD